MVQCCRIFWADNFSAILFLVKMLDPAVNAEMDGLGEVFDMGRAMGSLMLLDADMTGMGY